MQSDRKFFIKKKFDCRYHFLVTNLTSSFKFEKGSDSLFDLNLSIFLWRKKKRDNREIKVKENENKRNQVKKNWVLRFRTESDIVSQYLE